MCRKPYAGSPILTSPSLHLTSSATVEHITVPVTDTSAAITAIRTTIATPADAVKVYLGNSQYLIRTVNAPSVSVGKSRDICQQWGGELTNINSNEENMFIAGEKTLKCYTNIFTRTIESKNIDSIL